MRITRNRGAVATSSAGRASIIDNETSSTYSWEVRGRFLRARTPSSRFSSRSSPPLASLYLRAGWSALTRPPEWREDKLSHPSAPAIVSRGPPLCPKGTRSRTPASHLQKGGFCLQPREGNATAIRLSERASSRERGPSFGSKTFFNPGMDTRALRNKYLKICLWDVRFISANRLCIPQIPSISFFSVIFIHHKRM